MSLGKYSNEQIKTMSMIDLAYHVLTKKKEAVNFNHLFHEISEYKQLTEEKRQSLLAQFYTDLNIDGRFTTIGSNVWGLKRWYSVKKTSEKLLAEANIRERENEDLYEDEEVSYDDNDEQEQNDYDVYETE